MTHPTTGSETIVVGGGVIGLSIAFELAQLGRGVTVLERDRVGRGATWTAGGMLAPVAEAETEEPEVVALGRESLERFPSFVSRVEQVAGSSVGYRNEGTLWVAVHRDDREELQRLEEVLRAKGLHAERLSAERVLETEPHLTGRVLGALLLSGDHQVDPRRLTRCLVRAVERMGGRVVEGLAVERIVERHGRVDAVVGRRRRDGEFFEWRGTEVVLAAGAWSFSGIEVPVEDPGLRPVKGQLLRLRGEPLIEHVVRSPDVYLIPRTDGELLVGATMEESGFDHTATAGAALDLLRHAWEVLPATYDLELSELCVGLRSAVEDHRPVIGACGVEGLYLALGHFRNGVLLAPATAHHLARWIREGSAPDGLAPFAAARLAADRPARHDS